MRRLTVGLRVRSRQSCDLKTYNLVAQAQKYIRKTSAYPTPGLVERRITVLRV